METMTGKKMRTGSLTVELAGLLPVIFLAVFGVLSMSFYVHDRAWLSAAAEEAAVSGSIAAVTEKSRAQEEAKRRAEELLRMLSNDAQAAAPEIKAHAGQIEVVYRGSKNALYGGMRWEFTAQAKRRLCQPVGTIRKLRIGKEWADHAGGV